MSTIANTPLSNAEQIFYDLVWQPVVKAGEAYIEAQVTFLAAPIVKPTLEAIIQIATDWTFGKLKLLIDVTAIRLLNSAHQSAYDNASLELAIVAQEKGITSAEFFTARDKARLALSSFTQFGK